MEDKILMVNLLEKFKECDMFSLTGSIENVIITEQERDNALEQLKNGFKKSLLKLYDEFNKEYNFISFEDLYNEIEEECINFGVENKEFYERKSGHFFYSYIKSEFGSGTKYAWPNELFKDFYRLVSWYLDSKMCIEKIIKETDNKLNPIDKIEDEILKSNLIKYEVLFYNHCTMSCGPMINYYFKLNVETKKWLTQFESDFDIKGNLDDLAFYKNNELVFSSCTHEKFNSLTIN